MRGRLLTDTLSPLCCLNHFSSTSLMSLCSGFWNWFILNLFYLNTRKILVLFFQNLWITAFTKPNSNTWQLYCFHFLLLVSLLTLPLMLETFLTFMTVDMLSHYQSPVKCRSRTAKANFTHQEITVITVIVKAW